ncbi:MAG: hypothetical protein ACTSXC_03120 [Candidatus Freyarchaeota archaeon]
MPKGVARERKLIAVPGELVRTLNEIANREGKPFHEYTVEALEQAVKANRMGRTLKEIVDFYRVMEVRKASGHVLIPRETLNLLIKKLYPKEGKNLRETWLEAGRWFGKFLAARIHGDEAVNLFIKTLTESEWELDEVKLEEKGDVLTLRLISFTMPEENTELLMNYVEGAMESLGYKTENKESMRGMITLNLQKT